ncbi:MerR family transcriptional regulator [Kyrpidia spormannii]|uniref:MerR family transcriptional regulator n=3 Tax=Kyrpidia TaxID=1129704 RepID=A0A2K8N4C1_9BACL|nr:MULTISPECIES: MerR family transcriptional regulator [Kyrpidia]ADG06810.1 transcriptional regulator, MerR family [Kyrpidia tusciae DSM 2912]ATY83995.1 MerR family transcriptional regulator [Kyrpidia spormannii]CAB3389954.1 MerR family transcriptional regulator [Kyrpidia spormannii]CAB3390852.1 MerR family transcriptional regulator [Kyrpidia spormannii]
MPSEPREYQISDLVQEFQISPRTIRYYEELGLVQPRRTAGNHRIYSRRDRARLKMILRGKMLGFSLREIAVLIQLYDIDPTEKRQYEEGLRYAYKHLEEVRHRIAELKLLEADLVEAIHAAETKYGELSAETNREETTRSENIKGVEPTHDG